MKEASSDSPSYIDRVRSWARTKAHGPSPLAAGTRRSSVLPLSNTTSSSTKPNSITGEKNNKNNAPDSNLPGPHGQATGPTANTVADDISADGPPPAPPPEAEGEGSLVRTGESKKKNVITRFSVTAKSIIFSSWINLLLVFVPVGIAVEAAGVNPVIIFSMNAIAIIPLAGLLSHATESVAKRMGDTVGALMNVTFGNAVELIIFMYVYLSRDQDKKEREALLKALSYQSRPISSLLFFLLGLLANEIRIVQASLLGSILANLLLILGMCFLVGGLRFREQIYNSTVTQMSACLLSLSVMSLLLPTAFHAAFSDAQQAKANNAVLQVSRGTSVILLIVYGMYLLFQLKSHAYMYESTPQHIIDEEAHPGPIAHWMESSSSSEDDSSGSDTDTSHDSNTTAGRIRRVMRGGRKRRKSSAGSTDQHPTRTPSYSTSNTSPVDEESGPSLSLTSPMPHRFGAIDMAEDTIDDGVHDNRSRSHSFQEVSESKPKKERRHRGKKKHHKKKDAMNPLQETSPEVHMEKQGDALNEPRRVDFAVTQDVEAQQQIADQAPKRPFTFRGMSIRPTLVPTVFTQPESPHLGATPAVTGPIPRVRYGIRRTNSLPDRLNQTSTATRPGPSPLAANPVLSMPLEQPIEKDEEEEENISRTTAIILLLISTGLVATCAEFMVSSIDSVTSTTALGETFVGLIILPIVGNAAEHVTAVTVAAKNKMDLAIGVAVGSSIQIALFVTPFIVLLGWMMSKEMSLYFTLFETVCLFVSAFIVNFLVLDGRSNYLEGSLLCAAYVIIAVGSYFYPADEDQSVLGGNAEAGSKMIRSLLGLEP